MSTTLDVPAALAFVREHGIVLVSAKGPVPRLIEAILGESISGNWWAHPRSRTIYGVLVGVTDSPDVLVCRLLRGKLTLVHRRLWPALVRLAYLFAGSQIARIDQQHTATGRHVNRETPYPLWVPPDVHEEASLLDTDSAHAALGPWVAPATASPPIARTGQQE